MELMAANDTDKLQQAFRELTPTAPRLFHAPGRVNLIGEHTDYNDGFVLPVAIDRGTTVAGAKRDDRRVRVRSLNMEETVEFDLDVPGDSQRGIWLDYVEGMARTLEARGVRLCGADLALHSDIPDGAGLSSSAALEISVGMALLTLSGARMDRVALALAGQEAEHKYVGTRCGIMDQLTVTCARAGHALLIDCRTLENIYIPLDTASTAIVVADTGIKHRLASSAYNERRAECERAVEILREPLPHIRALRDVCVADFERHQMILPEPVRSRCKHVVTENKRTLLAAQALRSGDVAKMGRLLNCSHKSLRDDYEVSCTELDVMVKSAQSLPGATLGARMTGGGFGGATVNLVRRDALEGFPDAIALDYLWITNISPSIYVVEASDGAAEITDGNV